MDEKMVEKNGNVRTSLARRARISRPNWPEGFRVSISSNPVKTGFVLHGNAENRRCSIFGTSEIGATQTLTSDLE